VRLKWTALAVIDLTELRTYIAENDPAAAERVAQRIQDAVKNLREFPNIGRRGQLPNTRELIISNLPYFIPYTVVDGTIYLLRVYHSARRWPQR